MCDLNHRDPTLAIKLTAYWDPTPLGTGCSWLAAGRLALVWLPSWVPVLPEAHTGELDAIPGTAF
jgi:hypothetical protein